MSISALSHDTFFKKSLAIPNVAKEYLQMNLPQRVQKLMDFSTLNMEKESFIDEALKTKFSDVLFSCKTNTSRQAFIYLLCEHQSRPDHWMSMRLHRYILAIAEQYMKKNPKTKKLPLIYPIVFYNGQKPHNAPRALYELFDYPDIAKEFLAEGYKLVDSSTLADQDLKERVWGGTMLFFMKHAFDRKIIELLGHMRKSLTAIHQTAPHFNFIENILWYNENKVITLDEDQVQDLRSLLVEITNNEDTENIVMGTFAQKYIEVGIIQGIEKGVEKGRGISAQEIVKRMLDLNIEIKTISLATGLAEERILKIK